MVCCRLVRASTYVSLDREKAFWKRPGTGGIFVVVSVRRQGVVCAPVFVLDFRVESEGKKASYGM